MAKAELPKSRRNTAPPESGNAKGMREYDAGESYRQGEAVRRAGGGRKKKTEIYPNLEKRILELVEANDGTYGAPTDDRKWTALSQRKLSRM